MYKWLENALSEAEKNQILKEMQDLKTQLEYEKNKNN